MVFIKKFCIQTVDGRIVHDFSFHLIKAIEYQNWIQNKRIYHYELYDDIPDDSIYESYLPIGSIQYTFEFLELFNKIDKSKKAPINIPDPLMRKRFLKREVIIDENNKNPFESKRAFVKSNSMYKAPTDILLPGGIAHFESDSFLYSEEVDIFSEWRCFVFDGKLVGAKHYLGDFRLHPEYKMLDRMIDVYKNSPLSYTLDVGVNQNGTFLIEVHPLFSCGLYGFSDYRILVQMMTAGISYLKN